MDQCSSCPQIIKKIDEIHEALIGTVTSSTKALIPQVERHERALKNIGRALWLVGSSAVGSFILVFIEAITKR